MVTARWCVTHACPEDPPSGRCFAWLNDQTVPVDPECTLIDHKPRRIRLSRRKGWRLPSEAKSVARPTRYGNPCHWQTQTTLDPVTLERHPADPVEARHLSVVGFRQMLADPESRAINGYPSDVEIRAELAGRDLACWCPLEDDTGNRMPCHADILLEIANGWKLP